MDPVLGGNGALDSHWDLVPGDSTWKKRTLRYPGCLVTGGNGTYTSQGGYYMEETAIGITSGPSTWRKKATVIARVPSNWSTQRVA